MTPAAPFFPDDELPPGVSRNRPLAPLTSWKIGGPAAFYAEATTGEELQGYLRFAVTQRLPVVTIGGGTNILVADEGFPGLVLRCGTRAWTIQEDASDLAILHAGARTSLASVARGTAQAGWTGLEWAEGIPGTVGGAVIGNAGAFGGEIAQVFISANAYSMAQGSRRLLPEDIAFRYRGTALRDEPAGIRFLLDVFLLLQRGDAADLAAKLQDYAARRKAHTPAGSSCGSVFKNPPGDHAGRLLEAAGLKGTSEGAAFISPIHANYIVNRGGATARDVLRLIDRARNEVLRQFGVPLDLEVRLVGLN